MFSGEALVDEEWKCEHRAYHFTDWWEMKPFPIIEFLLLTRSFQKSLAEKWNEDDVMKPEVVRKGVRMFKERIRVCEECYLPSTADQFKRILKTLEEGCTPAEITEHYPELMNRLEDECRRHVVMVIEPDYRKYFENPEFFDTDDIFDDQVSRSFPSANEDIAEAGKCLACGRATACVMHLQRVMEVGLRVLAAAVGVPEQNDWGRYLKEIEEQLIKRMKTSGARSPEEQFYAEAHAMFDSARRAWRNPTMHPEKTYSPERAQEILIAVRSFMRHLVTKLKETP